MIWRREILGDVHGFESTAGMKGAERAWARRPPVPPGLGRRAEPVFLYEPDLRVYHWVPAEDDHATSSSATANGQFEARFALAQEGSSRLRLVGATLRTIAVEIPTVLLKRRHYRTTQNWYFEHCFIPIQHVSTLLRLLGLRISVSQRES